MRKTATERCAPAVERWTALVTSRFSARGLLTRVWELRANISAYDATYVALAEALGCPLVTADARLIRARGPRCRITVLPMPPDTPPRST